MQTTLYASTGGQIILTIGLSASVSGGMERWGLLEARSV